MHAMGIGATAVPLWQDPQAQADAKAAHDMWSYTRGELGFPYWAWGYVVDSVTQKPVPYPRISVYDPYGVKAPKDYTGDAGGVWNLALPSGRYLLAISADGYGTYTNPATVVSNGYRLFMAKSAVPTPVIIPGVTFTDPAKSYTLLHGESGFPLWISAYITDALTASPIGGAVVKVLKADGTQYGPDYITKSGGDMSFGLPNENFTISVTAPGYSTSNNPASAIGVGSHISLMPGGGDGGSVTKADGTVTATSDSGPGAGSSGSGDNTTMYLIGGALLLGVIGYKKGWFNSRRQTHYVHHRK